MTTEATYDDARLRRRFDKVRRDRLKEFRQEIAVTVARSTFDLIDVGLSCEEIHEALSDEIADVLAEMF